MSKLKSKKKKQPQECVETFEELEFLVTNLGDHQSSAHTASLEEEVNSNIDSKISISKRYAAFSDSSDESDNDNEVDSERKAAWIDENDVFTVQEVVDYQDRKLTLGSKGANDYKQNLEERYKSIMGAPKWAKKRKLDDEIDLLTKAGSLVKKKKNLKKGILEIQKLRNLNERTNKEWLTISSVLFHPTSTVGLVSGSNCVASLYQVDGKENTKLQSIKFMDFPIRCSAFIKNGEEFLVGSQYNYFYSHDLISGKSEKVRTTFISGTTFENFRISPDGRIIAVCGRFGDIMLLASTTKEHIATLHMNDEVTSLAFHEEKMFSHGTGGQVYVWDLKSRECVHKFIDEGCLTGTSVAASYSGKMLACGSSAGVVNLYDLEEASLSTAPKPLKTIYNLVTEVNDLKFNATSEILCFSSREKINAIRLLHCPSMTVFSNFPPFHATYNKVQNVEFSPNSGFMAFGDNSTNAHLFRLNHYGNY